MPRWIYINGRYVLAKNASISVQDRGFQFGDGIYGVMAYYDGRFVDEANHLEVLDSYCQRIYLPFPLSPQALCAILREMVRRNRLTSAHIYIQITRGQATRLHRFPDRIRPSLVIVASPWSFTLDADNLPCVKVVTAADIRWQRSDVKTTSMLATVLLREHAHQQQAFETWLLDKDEYISEGASSNAFMVTKQGALVTRPADGSLIPGVTRARLLQLAVALKIPIEERAFSKQESYEAAEAFLSGATSLIKAVTCIDNHVIGSGKPGPLTRALAHGYFHFFKNGD